MMYATVLIVRSSQR